jgi:tetratricopeptide (TPR) repeat protein
MGFTARKSIKLAPGVRMTFSKSGVSYSAGTKGYRVTKTASGRVQRTTSIPGTGISHTKTLSTGRSAPSTPTHQPPKPSWLAPKGEKDLYKAVQAGDADAMYRAGREHPSFAFPAAVLGGLFKFRQGDTPQALELLEWAFAQGRDTAGDPFLSKYASASRISLEVAPGALAELGLDRSTVGLALAELYQDTGDLPGAIRVVEQVEPTTFAALSLAELYLQAGEHGQVVELTQNVQNEDDATALLCVFRGAALREQGYCDAAREAFKEALKSKKRATEVRHRALYERARTYEAEGRRAMARKDLERIMAEDSTYPGLADAIAGLAD